VRTLFCIELKMLLKFLQKIVKFYYLLLIICKSSTNLYDEADARADADLKELEEAEAMPSL
jgi:hypothetical protein